MNINFKDMFVILNTMMDSIQVSDSDNIFMWRQDTRKSVATRLFNLCEELKLNVSVRNESCDAKEI